MAETTYNRGKSSVEDFASHAQDKFGDVADRASETAREAGDAVRHYANRASDKVEQSVHDYPLATIAGAAALGLLVGMVLKR